MNGMLFIVAWFCTTTGNYSYIWEYLLDQGRHQKIFEKTTKIQKITKKCDANLLGKLLLLKVYGWRCYFCHTLTYCVKSIFRIFAHFGGNLWSKYPHSVQIRENTDQKKLSIWTLFRLWFCCLINWSLLIPPFLYFLPFSKVWTCFKDCLHLFLYLLSRVVLFFFFFNFSSTTGIGKTFLSDSLKFVNKIRVNTDKKDTMARPKFLVINICRNRLVSQIYAQRLLNQKL